MCAIFLFYCEGDKTLLLILMELLTRGKISLSREKGHVDESCALVGNR